MLNFAELITTNMISPIPSPGLPLSLRRFVLRIYYEDTDAGGVVYHANYLKYFERARTDYLGQFGVGLQKMAEQYQAMFVLKTAQVDYHLPARLDDEISVTTELEKLDRASAVFLQKTWRGDECLVDGRFKIGCVGANTVRPCAIPLIIYNAMHQSLLLNQ